MRHLRLRSLLTLPAVLALVVFAQGPMAAAFGADCGDTSGPGATDIPCRCGDTVTTSTVLKASDPVTSTVCPALGLAVAAGITLNLGGKTLRGTCPLGLGLQLSAGATTTVTRGRLIGFETGLAGTGVTDSTISLLQVLDSCGGGIALESSHRNTIEKNTVDGTTGGTAIEVEGDANKVQLNRASESAVGLVVRGAGNTVSRNGADRNRSGGIVIDGTRALVELNRGNLTESGVGIRIVGTGHTVNRNSAHRTGGGQSGLSVSATGSTFSHNCIDNNTGFGYEDDTTGSGTAGTANTYVKNFCAGNDLGGSNPPGLCK